MSMVLSHIAAVCVILCNCAAVLLSGSFLHSLNIKFWRNVKFVRDIFSILFSLSDAFCQQIFNLSVYRTEIIFRPGCNGIV